MKIEINYQPSSDTYDWKMYTGPDGIDEYEGNGLDLGQCFEQIIMYRTLNSLDYLASEARIALGEPEPEPLAQEPTDDQLHQPWLELFVYNEGVSSGDVAQIVRAALARWGNP
jgi:hypothetical protein